jgi:hypothetical protein
MISAIAKPQPAKVKIYTVFCGALFAHLRPHLGIAMFGW